MPNVFLDALRGRFVFALLGASLAASACDGGTEALDAHEDTTELDGGDDGTDATPDDAGMAASGCLLCGDYVPPESPRLRRVVVSEGATNTTSEWTYDASGQLAAFQGTTLTGSFTYDAGALTHARYFVGAQVGISAETVLDGDTYVGANVVYDGRAFGQADNGDHPVTTTIRVTREEARLTAIDTDIASPTESVGTVGVRVGYGPFGVVDNVTELRTELRPGFVIGEDDPSLVQFLYASPEVVERIAITELSGDARSIAITYDAQGRVAELRTSLGGTESEVATLSYNSSGLVSRIEVTDAGGAALRTATLTYEPGTTPTVQFTIGDLLSVRGELSPFTAFNTFNFTVAAEAIPIVFGNDSGSAF